MIDQPGEDGAANGLLSRRQVLRLGLTGGAAAVAGAAGSALAVETPAMPAWSRQPGPGVSGYGHRSPHTGHIQRLGTPATPLYPGGGASFSPLQALHGTITPNALHFERHHAGVPAIDPAGHQLLIHGLVRRPLSFSYEDLLSYPMVSRIHFIECSGNSRDLAKKEPVDAGVQQLHGLVSCAEWTGIPLGTLLDEAGMQPEASWLHAVGADAASMGRSLPMAKVLDDVMLALYQNGEPLRPEQGYPMRLVVPGWEGNTHIKWVTQLKLATAPAQFRDETSKYTDILPDGRSRQFTFPMGCKSVITSPSGGMRLERRGFYPISGLAWSGAGSISRVALSADGGRTWTDAAIESAALPIAPVRFQGALRWQGQPAQLLSRAYDDRGNVQPLRNDVIARDGHYTEYHYNGTQCWGIAANGEVSNVYV